MTRRTIWILAGGLLFLAAEIGACIALSREPETWAPAIERPTGGYAPLPRAVQPGR